MGAAYPELVRAEALIIETLQLEETRFRQTLDTRPGAARRGDRGACRPATAAARRGGLQALRHLRLPARPDAGRAARARDAGRQRRLRGGDGRAARRGARRLGRLRRGRHRAPLVRDPREGRAPPSSSATPPSAPRARSWRSWSTARSDRVEGGPDRLDRHQPDAVLRRVRRPGGRYRPLHRRRRRGRDHRHAEEAGRSACPSRQGRGRRAQAGRRLVMAIDRPPRAAPRPPFGDPPAARGAAPPARQARDAEGLAGRARPAALRHQPAADHARGAAPDRGRGQRPHPRERRRSRRG